MEALTIAQKTTAKLQCTNINYSINQLVKIAVNNRQLMTISEIQKMVKKLSDLMQNGETYNDEYDKI